MPTIEIFATGDEIGTFSSVSSSGNSNGMKVTLGGVQPLGSATDVFRIVIRQVNTGGALFQNGQLVDIYAWPDTDPPSPPIYSSLNPQHDQFQGRASSAEHQIFTSAGVVLDLNGITAGTLQYGPGINPPRDQQLSFTSFSPDPPVFPCFAAGTLIEAEGGPRAVETLREGDLVLTADNGLQPIRWIGQRRVSGLDRLAPILIKAGALGNYRDLLVSPQHRMLMQDWRMQIYFAAPQVLVAAKHLVNGKTITLAPRQQITYVHLAFDRHEIIFAEGCPSESLFLADESMASLGAEALAELREIFPELRDHAPGGKAARAFLRGWEAALVA
ncbi:MAG: Hint domain-containing protein [Rhodobacterales bacterium]|nr:Hint domain-containing protein [Rhodobacterales bacterium]MDX5390757.1 Hint domain-containing protein [Rhodobacterales bacterium]MDX5490458.1 Hint domain-containing protein [Rhodobacterales bacterium]